MVHSPHYYAKLLKQKILRYDVRCWLVNTGWSGGPYGVGQRMKIAYTRAMIRAALSGTLDDVPFDQEPAFGLLIPTKCPDVPPEVLNPRSTWEDPQEYDTQARKLAKMFGENFQQYVGRVQKETEEAGPRA